jgi:hypothetical protein
MTTESPIVNSACMSLPPGPGIFCVTFAPNAFV